MHLPSRLIWYTEWRREIISILNSNRKPSISASSSLRRRQLDSDKLLFIPFTSSCWANPINLKEPAKEIIDFFKNTSLYFLSVSGSWLCCSSINLQFKQNMDTMKIINMYVLVNVSWCSKNGSKKIWNWIRKQFLRGKNKEMMINGYQLWTPRICSKVVVKLWIWKYLHGKKICYTTTPFSA